MASNATKMAVKDNIHMNTRVIMVANCHCPFARKSKGPLPSCSVQSVIVSSQCEICDVQKLLGHSPVTLPFQS